MRHDERSLRRREWSPAVCVCVRAWLRAWLRVHLCVRAVCMGLLSKAAPSEVPSWSPRFVPTARQKQHSRFARSPSPPPSPPFPPLLQSFSPGGAVVVRYSAVSFYLRKCRRSTLFSIRKMSSREMFVPTLSNLLSNLVIVRSRQWRRSM